MLGLAAGGALALAIGGAWRWRAQCEASESAPVVLATLTVLPFKPLILESRDELLEVGMADSLIARLSTIPGLDVRSVGSVRRYAGPDQDPLRAARELNVGWIVDGSLQRWGGQVRVTPRLLKTADGAALWSGSFDEPFNGMFDVQDAISERVAHVLAPRLSQPDQGRLAGLGGTRNTDAYQFYLAARRSAQGIRAVAEGHAALEWIRFWYDWDWPAAEAAFRRAVEFNRNCVEGHFGLGLLLLTQARTEEGLAQFSYARELDPVLLILITLESNYPRKRSW